VHRPPRNTSHVPCCSADQIFLPYGYIYRYTMDFQLLVICKVYKSSAFMCIISIIARSWWLTNIGQLLSLRARYIMAPIRYSGGCIIRKKRKNKGGCLCITGGSMIISYLGGCYTRSNLPRLVGAKEMYISYEHFLGNSTAVRYLVCSIMWAQVTQKMM
jgi:hypothetical protein